jgi:cytochrome c
MTLNNLLALVLSLTTVSAMSQDQQQSPPRAQPAKTARKAASTPGQQHPEVGQLVFEQNCSRCHTAPDGFSAHISGTVAMHMRVRASLSEADAQAVLRFLNP